MRSFFTAWILLLLLLPQQLIGQQVEGRLIELDALQQLASQPDAETADAVTVLLPLAKADIVQAASSVERTFTGKSKPKLQSVSSSQAVFITGSPALVYEAVRRLIALDDATPEPKPRTRTRAKPSDGTAVGADDIADYGPDVNSLSNGIAIFGIGILVLGLVVFLLIRRSFR